MFSIQSTRWWRTGNRQQQTTENGSKISDLWKRWLKESSRAIVVDSKKVFESARLRFCEFEEIHSFTKKAIVERKCERTHFKIANFACVPGDGSFYTWSESYYFQPIRHGEALASRLGWERIRLESRLVNKEQTSTRMLGMTRIHLKHSEDVHDDDVFPYSFQCHRASSKQHLEQIELDDVSRRWNVSYNAENRTHFQRCGMRNIEINAEWGLEMRNAEE